MAMKRGQKAALIGAALAGLWGTAALANGDFSHKQGTGGAGSAGTESEEIQSPCQKQGVGGSAGAGMEAQPQSQGCVNQGTGGAGQEGIESQSQTGLENPPSMESQTQTNLGEQQPAGTNVTVMPVEEPTAHERRMSRWHEAGKEIKRYPVAVRVGGGAEGVAGDLNKKLTGGPAWNATLSAQPLTWMGAEIAYNGATHEVDNEVAGTNQVTGAVNGADFVTNGGQAALTFNLPTPVIQPYAMGGIGFDRWTYRAADNAVFQDDTAGRVPFGGGLKSNVGQLSADLRFNYNVLFSQNFARVGNGDGPGSSYDLALQVGARF